MMSLTIHIPKEASLDENEAKLFFAAALFEKGKLTLNQAVTLAEVNKNMFTTYLSNNEIAFHHYDADQLNEDLNNARTYSR